MPSGYEKSPDYGGPEPTWRGIALLLVVVVALITFFYLTGVLSEP